MATQTQVLIAHTGQRLQVDISQFATLDDFKAWVARTSSISQQNIIALTPQGKTVKIQTIQSEREIYIYDVRITQASPAGTPTSLTPEEPIPKQYTVTNAPDYIENTHSLQSWQDLFKSRRDWALKVVEDCAAMAEAFQARNQEMEVMAKCLDAAVANLDGAARPLEPKFDELQKWVKQTQEVYSRDATNWEQYLGLARSINISPAMVRFMTEREIRGSRHATLEDLVDLDTARKAGKLAGASLRKFNNKVTELDRTADKMFGGCDDLYHEVEKVMSRSILAHSNDAAQLLEDIEAVAKKIDTDYQATLAYSSSTRDVLQASKTAANHTERLLPSIQNRAREMDELLRDVTQARNELSVESLTLMRTVAEITGFLHILKTMMNVLNQGEEEMDTFDYLHLIQQLPFMYASHVAEAVRRKEWADKVKTDSSTLVNEMALFQDEELKRRRKWQKNIGSTYNPDKTENNVIGLEVNLLGAEEPWPNVTKKDLDDFLAALERNRADASVIEDIKKLIDELNSPTKQQAKRVKAFKNGSVHEAALGRSGLLVRGDDDLLRGLQAEKGRLEGKLKTAESRVRRLEGLLHRQSTESRPSIGNLFQPGSHERNNSISSIRSPGIQDDRRYSSGVSDNSEALLRRITQLEGDLVTEKEKSAVFGKETAARTRDMEGRVDEVEAIKKDLLQNMDALQKEFDGERKTLENEIKTLKSRLEETEDEIEHFGQSREDEKGAFVERMRSLEDEVERLTQEKADETLRTQGQVEFLRNEARMQRDRNESLEKQLQEANETVKALSRRAEASEASAETHLHTLKDIHGHISPQEQIPDDVNELMEAVTTKSSDILSKVMALEEDMALLKSDLDIAHETIKESKSEVTKTQDKLSSEETARFKLHEALEEEKAKCVTLESEITEAREQLSELRTKMTEGESGSETLRKKLEEKEKRVAELMEGLAARQSHTGSLEEEVRMYREKLDTSDLRAMGLSQRFEGRNERTKDLTQRLFTYNERLLRLLERLSFSVNRQDGTMTIQKIPRAERTSRDPNDSSDPSSSVRRSVSMAATLADSTDLKLLYWMNADDAELETSQYHSFVSGPGSFDIDAFAEAIYRRVKELEHTARKYTKDARNYRERAHQAAKDAHDKIAFRHFKEGDLALFLPTRNQTTGAWAAFNVGCPHFFLREQESHRLRQREWLVARITRVQERVVDLSKSLSSSTAAHAGETDSVNTSNESGETEFDNPFDLSDGLRWWLVDAVEDKAGAPSTPGLGKSTVAANTVAAVADIHTHQARTGASRLLPGGKNTGIEGVSRTLSKSLESRRSSSGSVNRKTLPFAGGAGAGAAKSSALASETNSLRAGPSDSPDLAGSAGAIGKGKAVEQSAEPVSSNTKATGGHAEGNEDWQRMPPPPHPSSRPTSTSPTKSKPASLYRGSPSKQRSHASHPHNATVGSGQQQLHRDTSNASVDSRDKSVVWDSLWSLDVSYPGK